MTTIDKTIPRKFAIFDLSKRPVSDEAIIRCSSYSKGINEKLKVIHAKNKSDGWSIQHIGSPHLESKLAKNKSDFLDKLKDHIPIFISKYSLRKKDQTDEYNPSNLNLIELLKRTLEERFQIETEAELPHIKIFQGAKKDFKNLQSSGKEKSNLFLKIQDLGPVRMQEGLTQIQLDKILQNPEFTGFLETLDQAMALKSSS